MKPIPVNELSRGVKVGGEGEGERGGARIPAGTPKQQQPSRSPGSGRRWLGGGGSHTAVRCHRRGHTAAAPGLPLQPPGRPLGGARAAERFNRAAAAVFLRPSPVREASSACPALTDRLRPSPLPCPIRLSRLVLAAPSRGDAACTRTRSQPGCSRCYSEHSRWLHKCWSWRLK